jgi:hypothetical protein
MNATLNNLTIPTNENTCRVDDAARLAADFFELPEDEQAHILVAVHHAKKRTTSARGTRLHIERARMMQYIEDAYLRGLTDRQIAEESGYPLSLVQAFRQISNLLVNSAIVS